MKKLLVSALLLVLILPVLTSGCTQSNTLQVGEYEWRLTSVNISSHEVSFGGDTFRTDPGYVFLRANFESVSQTSLTQAWAMKEVSNAEGVGEITILRILTMGGVTGVSCTNLTTAEKEEIADEISDAIMDIAKNTFPDNWSVYVTDYTGEKYPSAVIEESYILFTVPEDSQGFTLYFLDAEPIELDEWISQNEP